jgi:hypothetical protein
LGRLLIWRIRPLIWRAAQQDVIRTKYKKVTRAE